MGFCSVKTIIVLSINTVYSVSPTRFRSVAHSSKAMYCGSVGRGIQSRLGTLFFLLRRRLSSCLQSHMAPPVTLKSFHPTRLLLAGKSSLLEPIVTYIFKAGEYGLTGVCLPAIYWERVPLLSCNAWSRTSLPSKMKAGFSICACVINQ